MQFLVLKKSRRVLVGKRQMSSFWVAVSAVASLFMVLATYLIFLQNKSQEELVNRAHVVVHSLSNDVYSSPEQNIFIPKNMTFILENNGKTAARDLSFFVYSLNREGERIILLDITPVGVLAPEQTTSEEFELDNVDALFSLDNPRVVTIEIEYYTYYGECVKYQKSIEYSVGFSPREQSVEEVSC